MALRVKESDLTSYGAMVGRAAGDAREAKSYLDKHGQISGSSEGMFPEVFQVHDQLLPKVQGLFKDLERILNGSSSELKRSATYYRETEHENAASFDALLPDVKR